MLPGSSSPRRWARRRRAASSSTKSTRSSARWRLIISKRSAITMKISRKRATKKCASCSLAPRSPQRLRPKADKIDPLPPSYGGASNRRIDMTDGELVREVAQPLTGGADDYDALLELIGDARIVLLGEASHGTHEFYFERAAITKRLSAEKGFTVLAIEADWPDASRVHRYVRGADE